MKMPVCLVNISSKSNDFFSLFLPFSSVKCLESLINESINSQSRGKQEGEKFAKRKEQNKRRRYYFTLLSHIRSFGKSHGKNGEVMTRYRIQSTFLEENKGTKNSGKKEREIWERACEDIIFRKPNCMRASEGKKKKKNRTDWRMCALKKAPFTDKKVFVCHLHKIGSREKKSGTMARNKRGRRQFLRSKSRSYVREGIGVFHSNWREICVLQLHRHGKLLWQQPLMMTMTCEHYLIQKMTMKTSTTKSCPGKMPRHHRRHY